MMDMVTIGLVVIVARGIRRPGPYGCSLERDFCNTTHPGKERSQLAWRRQGSFTLSLGLARLDRSGQVDSGGPAQVGRRVMSSLTLSNRICLVSMALNSLSSRT
jgi:hypothetical protein